MDQRRKITLLQHKQMHTYLYIFGCMYVLCGDHQLQRAINKIKANIFKIINKSLPANDTARRGERDLQNCIPDAVATNLPTYADMCLCVCVFM